MSTDNDHARALGFTVVALSVALEEALKALAEKHGKQPGDAHAEALPGTAGDRRVVPQGLVADVDRLQLQLAEDSHRPRRREPLIRGT